MPPNKKLEAENQSLREELEVKKLQVRHLQQLLFGRSSEKFRPDEWQLKLGFDGQKGKSPGKDPGAEEAEDNSTAPDLKEKPRRRRRTKKELLPDNLLVRIKEVIVPPEVVARPEAFKKIGEEHHDELQIIPAQLYIERTIREKYVSREDRSLPPMIVPASLHTIPGTKCGPGLMANVVVDRFVDHLPYYRQEKRFKREFGATVHRNTLIHWTKRCAEYLKPINSAILEEVLSGPVINIDETPLKYIKRDTGQTLLGYQWVYRRPALPGGGPAEAGSVYFDWRTGRGHDCLLDILEPAADGSDRLKYRGIVQCDGFSAYDALSERYGVTLAGCLAHVRRKIFEAAEQAPVLCKQLLEWIVLLYRIEAQFREHELTAWHRRQVREQHSRPVLKKIYNKLEKEQSKYLPQSALGKAISYALGQREKIEQYLENGYLEIDNNVVENAIRPNKLGAKNWMFIGAKEAGWRSALYYTLVENCRIQGIDPKKYLEELLQELPSELGAITPELAHEWTPSSYAARQREKVSDSGPGKAEVVTTGVDQLSAA